MTTPPPAARPDAALLAAVSAGGVLGAAGRYAITQAWPAQGFPWATFLVNASGCLLIGLLMGGVVEAGRGHRLTRPFLGVGVLGGYTTFSAYAVETHGLLGDRPAVGLTYLALTPLVAVAATAVGARWGRRVAR